MPNNQSILVTIKKLLGLAEDYDVFDTDLVTLINGAILAANQIGVGKEGFTITGQTETWEDFAGNIAQLDAVKQYIYMRVRLVFDPPANSFLVNAIEKQLDEMTWRLNVQAEAVGTNE